MNNRLMQTEDQIETRRALIKLLKYVEAECARVGYPTTGWMVAMSRSTLETELTGQPFLHFDDYGHPQLN